MKPYRVGFDLDGIISHIDIAYYKELATFDGIANYYSNMVLKTYPSRFLLDNDAGFIITCRSIDFEEVTFKWLNQNIIHFPCYLVGDKNIYQDWSEEYNQKLLSAKADKIKKLKLDIFFEDYPQYVKDLRDLCPKTRIIFID